MSTYGYGRVSTGQQTYDAQLDALTAQGIPADRIFLEKVGGARADRPQFLALLARVQPGDEIVTTRLDRFGRSLHQIINTVADLNARDIHVRTLTDGVDSRTSAGRMVMGILATLAEYELSTIRERAQAAREAARRRATEDGTLTATGGRPRSMSPATLAAARRMHDQGTGVREIARALQRPRSTISDALRRPPVPAPAPGPGE